jgi:hypothetical protein
MVMRVASWNATHTLGLGLSKPRAALSQAPVAGFKRTAPRVAGNGVAAAATANGARETAPQQERNGDGVARKG